MFYHNCFVISSESRLLLLVDCGLPMPTSRCNPVSAPGVGGNILLVAVQCSPHTEVALWPCICNVRQFIFLFNPRCWKEYICTSRTTTSHIRLGTFSSVFINFIFSFHFVARQVALTTNINCKINHASTSPIQSLAKVSRLELYLLFGLGTCSGTLKKLVKTSNKIPQK